MFLIQQITDDALQNMTLVLEDGTSLSLTLYFIPMQEGWFINNLTYGDFSLNGMRVTVAPNMLNQWRNILPFGLACASVNNREPSLQEDFSSGACRLYILSQQEVNEYANLLKAGVP